jgi:hypothetical protein
MERNGYGKVSLTGRTLDLAISPVRRLPVAARLALPGAHQPPRWRLPSASFFFFPPAFLADEIQDFLDQHPHCVRCRL